MFLTDILITNAAVKAKLKNLNPAKAMGPDKIPSIILKELNEDLLFSILYKYLWLVSWGIS